MKIRKPLSLSFSLSLPPCLVGVYMYPNPRLGHGSRHPSPTLRLTVLPFRIGARVSLAIQIHFLHDITGEIYTVAVITVWRDCLHFSHIVEKRTPQLLRWLRQFIALEKFHRFSTGWILFYVLLKTKRKREKREG